MVKKNKTGVGRQELCDWWKGIGYLNGKVKQLKLVSQGQIKKTSGGQSESTLKCIIVLAGYNLQEYSFFDIKTRVYMNNF